MPRTATIEIENAKGERVEVVVSSLKKGKVKQLRRECGIRYDPAIKGVVGDFFSYEERSVADAIVSPVELKTVTALDDLDDSEYNKIKEAVYSLQTMDKKETSFLSS